MLELDFCKKTIKAFVKVRMYLDDSEHSKTYQAFTNKLFGQVGQMPQYIVINAQGNITAQSGDIRAFNVGLGQDASKTPELFQRFVDSRKTEGFPFSFDHGFEPPAKSTSVVTALQ